MVNNIDRAMWARSALESFADQCMPGSVCKETIVDLICNVGHFAEIELGCQRDQVLELYRNGIGSWSAESRVPLGEPVDNDIVNLYVEGQLNKT